MRDGINLGAAEPDETTTASLRLMLSYVEAECLRIGAPDAAKHAAMAAALMTGLEVQPSSVELSSSARRPRSSRLH